MITYLEANFIRNFCAELARNTKGLPLYKGGPAIDYTEAPYAYALNATLLYDPERSPQDVRMHGPSETAKIMLVERASGHGVVGSFSGVSGYIDTLHNPAAKNSDGLFDPIVHTLKEEFVTECGFTNNEFGVVDFRAGKPTTEKRTIVAGAIIRVVPILGLCTQMPKVIINKTELKSFTWTELRSIKNFEKLARGYRSITLPSALQAIGLRSR